MTIAVITAWNPRNTGMYSVDLAACRFMRAEGLDFRLYRIQWGRKGPFALAGRRLLPLTSTELLRPADSIIYWGDFLNSPVYGINDFRFRELRHGRPSDKTGAFETWKRYCLLKEYPKGQQRIISASNSFQSANKTLTDLGEKEAKEVSDLLARFDAIFPRDRVSTQEVRSILPFGAETKVECGVDAAFLNRLYSQKIAKRIEGTFVWFFHRSGLSIDDQTRLVSTVAKKTGLTPIHLCDWLSINTWTWDIRYRSLVRHIRMASFCLSDTYHCLINAMVHGTPAIGIGKRTNAQVGTLGDFKKKELFAMLGLGGLYVELNTQDETDHVANKIARIAYELIGIDASYRFFDVLDGKIEKYRDSLRRAIR